MKYGAFRMDKVKLELRFLVPRARGCRRREDLIECVWPRLHDTVFISYRIGVLFQDTVYISNRI